MASNKLEMITVVDRHGCVHSVEFIPRNHGGDKITIIRKREGDELPPRTDADEYLAK